MVAGASETRRRSRQLAATEEQVRVGPAVGRRAPEAEAERWRRAGGGHGRAGRRRPAGRRSRAGASAGAEAASREPAAQGGIRHGWGRPGGALHRPGEAAGSAGVALVTRSETGVGRRGRLIWVYDTAGYPDSRVPGIIF
jgi:hypothetical protein